MAKIILLSQKLLALIESYLLLFSKKIKFYFIKNNIGKKLKTKPMFLFLKKNLSIFFVKVEENSRFL